MSDTVSRGLDLLAAGLRPFVARQASVGHRDERTLSDIENGDIQFLLVFMWDQWNDLFRHELSYVERSLISELRDFRNRWAHQDRFTEHNVYRVLDDVERLLTAVKSDRLSEVSELRRESLNRLWNAEIGKFTRRSLLRVAWPYLLCVTSACAISFALLRYLSVPWSWILSTMVTLGMLRLAWHQSQRESIRTPGPRECSHCSRIIYTIECPYCHPASVKPTSDPELGLPKPLAVLPALRKSAVVVTGQETVQGGSRG